MKGVPSNVLAGCFSLAAFAVALVAGLAAGNSTGSILARGVIAMILCYPLGLLVGVVCHRVVEEQAAAHQEANPVPEVPEAEGDSAVESEEEDVLVV